jgi:hypothetical protein
MIDLAHTPQNRNPAHRARQAFVAASYALRHAYWRALAIGLDQLTPRQKWQFRCRFRKVCRKADRAGANAADICRILIGSTDLATLIEHVENVCAIDERAAAPECTDAVVIILLVEISDHRRVIRQSQPETRTGPPPKRRRRPRWKPGTPRSSKLGLARPTPKISEFYPDGKRGLAAGGFFRAVQPVRSGQGVAL